MLNIVNENYAELAVNINKKNYNMFDTEQHSPSPDFFLKHLEI